MMNRGKNLKTIQHVIEYVFVRAFYLLVKLTPDSFHSTLSNILATFARWVTRRRVKIAAKNLKLVFSESTEGEIVQVVRGVYRTIVQNAFDVFDAGVAIERIKLTGPTRQRFEEVGVLRAEGRPIVFATGHIGNWEILGQYIGSQFRDCVFVAQEQSNKLVDRYLNKRRVLRGANYRIIHSHQSARELPRTLKRGGAIFLVADQDAGKDGIVVDFLGTPASFHRGLASFAYHYDAPLVLLFLLRTEHQMTLHIPAIIQPNSGADRNAEVRRLVTSYSEHLGQFVRNYPDQWLWTHRRWKSTMPGY